MELAARPLLLEAAVACHRLQPGQGIALPWPAGAQPMLEQLMEGGLARASQRLGVTPLVTLVNRSG